MLCLFYVYIDCYKGYRMALWQWIHFQLMGQMSVGILCSAVICQLLIQDGLVAMDGFPIDGVHTHM